MKIYPLKSHSKFKSTQYSQKYTLTFEDHLLSKKFQNSKLSNFVSA